MTYHILTPFQQKILEAIANDDFIRHNFNFAGGTALSEFYLQHRLSEDLDFFTQNDINLEEIRPRMQTLLAKTGINVVEYRQYAGAKIFFLQNKPRETVKTDFNIFPYAPIAPPTIYLGLRVDNILDITLSKLDTICNRDKSRDFIDFYFIQQKYHYEIGNLIKLLEKKIEYHIDPLYLIARLTIVDTLHDYPKMLVKFDKNDMIHYFHQLADSLQDQIFTD